MFNENLSSKDKHKYNSAQERLIKDTKVKPDETAKFLNKAREYCSLMEGQAGNEGQEQISKTASDLKELMEGYSFLLSNCETS